MRKDDNIIKILESNIKHFQYEGRHEEALNLKKFINKRVKIMDTLQKHKEHLESKGHKVAYLALFGSQNYNLDLDIEGYEADIDTKAIIVPTLNNLVINSKPISEVVEMENGQCDIKDIRSFFETLLKANPSYIETLFTDYYIIDEDFISEFEIILDNADDLVYALRGQMIRGMFGMMKEKLKRLSHPYPTVEDKIEEFGYDGKQLSHIIRLHDVMKSYYLLEKSLSDALIPEDEERQAMVDAKTQKYSLEDAQLLAQSYINSGQNIMNNFLESYDEARADYTVKQEFLLLSQRITINKIIDEVRGE